MDEEGRRSARVLGPARLPARVRLIFQNGGALITSSGSARVVSIICGEPPVANPLTLCPAEDVALEC